MKRLLLIGLIPVLMLMAACSKGGIDDGTPGSIDPQTVTVSSASEKPYFYASGVLTITFTQDAACGSVALKNYVTKEQIMLLSAGTFVTESLPEEWYYIIPQFSCTWSAEITGIVELPSTDPDPLTGDCECEGCCEDNGGVVCFEERTRCADGTPLSTTCSEKGCIANGCPGCE